jgi:hypothetical protein
MKKLLVVSHSSLPPSSTADKLASFAVGRALTRRPAIASHQGRGQHDHPGHHRRKETKTEPSPARRLHAPPRRERQLRRMAAHFRCRDEVAPQDGAHHRSRGAHLAGDERERRAYSTVCYQDRFWRSHQDQRIPGDSSGKMVLARDSPPPRQRIWTAPLSQLRPSAITTSTVRWP